MRAWIALIMLLLAPLAPASDKTDAAVMAGARWLQQLDDNQLKEAYGLASPLMRNSVAFEAWQQALVQARGPLGPTLKRELIYGALEKELPGLARGEYAKLRFRTDFAANHEVTEHLTLILEADGQWRAIGYWLQ
jgi:hypothetical protein